MNSRPVSKSRSFGWILLLVVGAIATLGGLLSASVAYVGSRDAEVDVHVDQLRVLSPEVARAAQGRRGTAAAMTVGFGFLYCMIAATAFRRGERWAWWALLLSSLLAGAVILLRIPLLDTRLGTATGAALVVVTLVGVLVPARDFFRD